MIVEWYCKSHPEYRADYPVEYECGACQLMFQILNFPDENKFEDGSELAVAEFPRPKYPSVVEVVQ